MNNRIIRIIGAYSVFLGLSVMVLWIMILSGEPLEEGRTEMVFHLLSEFLMALLCILSGIFMLKGRRIWITGNLLAHAMVVYSVLNAAGYYGERGEFAMVFMFLVLLILSLSCIIILTTKVPDGKSEGPRPA